jgi:hypothetical protein
MRRLIRPESVSGHQPLGESKKHYKDASARLKELEQENRELRRANEILN